VTFRWKDIKTDHTNKGCKNVDRIQVFNDRHHWPAVVGAITNPLVSKKAGNFLTRSASSNFLRWTLLHVVRINMLIYAIIFVMLALLIVCTVTLRGVCMIQEPSCSCLFAFTKEIFHCVRTFKKTLT
jgi:hypothetical protein